MLCVSPLFNMDLLLVSVTLAHARAGELITVCSFSLIFLSFSQFLSLSLCMSVCLSHSITYNLRYSPPTTLLLWQSPAVRVPTGALNVVFRVTNCRSHTSTLVNFVTRYARAADHPRRAIGRRSSQVIHQAIVRRPRVAEEQGESQNHYTIHWCGWLISNWLLTAIGC